MATLSTTLAGAKQPRYALGGGTYGYGSRARSNPYGRLGANIPEQTMPANQGLYASLMLGRQQTTPAPPTQFQAQYNFDPVLARLSALGEMSVESARAEAAALKRRALIESGATDVARAAGMSGPDLEAVGANPTSTAALLKRDYGERERQMGEHLQQQNLWFGGERARRMEDLEFGRSGAESNYLGRLRDLLRQIDEDMMLREQEAILNAPPPITTPTTTSDGGGGGGDDDSTTPAVRSIFSPRDFARNIPGIGEGGVNTGDFSSYRERDNRPGEIPSIPVYALDPVTGERILIGYR